MFGFISDAVGSIAKNTVKGVGELVTLPLDCLEAAADGVEEALDELDEEDE